MYLLLSLAREIYLIQSYFTCWNLSLVLISDFANSRIEVDLWACAKQFSDFIADVTLMGSPNSIGVKGYDAIYRLP